jgi:hypothetical protein
MPRTECAALMCNETCPAGQQVKAVRTLRQEAALGRQGE